MSNIKKALYLFGIILLINSCTKGFLEKKPKTNIVLPTTIDNFEKLLDNFVVVNQSPSLPVASSDGYYISTYQLYQSCQPVTRAAYLWKKDLFHGQSGIVDWNNAYTAIFFANNAISGVAQYMDEKDSAQWNNLLGRALFIRGKAFYDLASGFAPPYESKTAINQLGIPLKLKSGIDEVVKRSTVEETYSQIISDLTKARTLLIQKNPDPDIYKPSKIAVDALLARIYLSMRNYNKADSYASSVLKIKDQLVDFNTLDTTSIRPFGVYNNPEVLYFTELNTMCYEVANYNRNWTVYSIDTNLIKLYSPNDLRLPIFFTKNSYGGYGTKLGYGIASPFSGLALDEIYLIKAECAARKKDNATALNYLNTLLEHRYTPGTFKPYMDVEGLNVLDLVLKERRKELVYRGLRWSDLRRLNLEGYNITLKRILNGQTYILPPNDPRYTFPIPDDEILYSHITQNER